MRSSFGWLLVLTLGLSGALRSSAKDQQPLPEGTAALPTTRPPTSARAAAAARPDASGPNHQYLASRVAQAKAAAVAWQANPASAQGNQFAAVVSRLDANLPLLITNQYRGDQTAQFALTYGLVGLALEGIDNTRSAHYKQKAISLSNFNISGSLRLNNGSRKFVARGDGTTTTFTIPDTTYSAPTFTVYLAAVSTISVVRGSTVQDLPLNVDDSVVKISNTRDGTPNYTYGVDWRYGSDNTYVSPSSLNFSQLGINWDLRGSGPTPGARYYITKYNNEDGNAVRQKLKTAYTLSGTTVTFATPPSLGQAILFEYMFGTPSTDGSTLGYQQTSDGRGYMDTAASDTGGYDLRNVRCVPIVFNWLWNYAAVTPTMRSKALATCWAWAQFAKDDGYAYNNPINNYGAGMYGFDCAAAVLLDGTDPANGPTLIARQTAYRTTYFIPAMRAPVAPAGGALPLATDASGHRGEGWNYGAQSTRQLLEGSLALYEAGYISGTDIAVEKAWANLIGDAVFIEQPTLATICDYGDGYVNGYEPFFTNTVGLTSSDFLYVVAYMASDTNVRARLNYAIQHYTGIQTQDYSDLAYRKPNASTSNPATAGLPTGKLFSSNGLVVARKDYSYSSTWLFAKCGNLVNAHDGVQGVFEIRYGGDDLIPLVDALTGVQDFKLKSRYGSCILIDDFGAGEMTYPSTGGSGPSMGIWYTPPNGCTVTLYETTAGHDYWSLDYGAAYGHNSSGVPDPVKELNRSQLFIRNSGASDYLITHDRVTTNRANYLKQFQFPINPAATINQTGTTITITKGTSKLFSKTFSDVALTTAVKTLSVQNKNDCKQFTVAPATESTAKVNFRTAMQIGPSTVSASDAMTDIPSTDNTSEGTKIGNVVAMFGISGLHTNGTSYQITATNGATITHYVTDLQPGSTYKLTGATTSSTMASAAGVATFNSTGTGSAQTIALASPSPATPSTGHADP